MHVSRNSLRNAPPEPIKVEIIETWMAFDYCWLLCGWNLGFELTWPAQHSSAQIRRRMMNFGLILTTANCGGGWSDALCPCWHCQSYLVWMNEWFRRKNVSQSLIPLKDIHPEICGSFMFVFPWDKGKSAVLARTLCII